MGERAEEGTVKKEKDKTIKEGIGETIEEGIKEIIEEEGNKVKITHSDMPVVPSLFSLFLHRESCDSQSVSLQK